ncbi:MAG: homoserine O-acetyltransferase [Kiritimatiellae bacterium]|nr:homoserine O-acetyltransferase [Kiritimatiellia bacterium]
MVRRGYEGESVGVVEPRTLKLALPPGGLVLEKGGVLPEVEISYETCGELAPDRSNVIYVCHALTGDAHVAGIRPGQQDPSGWWEGMIGPGRGIDTRYYHVVCANMLAGCKGTTGPSSINPATGKRYGSSFPEVTVGDIVTVQQMMLQQLGIERLAAVVGGSFGGMQVLEWAVRFPERVDRCLVIASAARLNTQALAFDIVGRRAITQDPGWQGGDYYGTERAPHDGLSQARRIAHITYLSEELMSDKFGRERRPEWVNAGADFHAEARRLFRTTFEVESYLDHQARKFIERFDANSYLQITRAMDEYDLIERCGSLEQAFQPARASFLIVSLSGDWLFTPEQSEEMVRALVKLGKSVSYCHLDAPAGHDAFLTHIEKLAPVLHAFLPWVGERPARAERVARERVMEYGQVMELVDANSRVLDLGCGDGQLLRLLAERKGIAGTGVEISFEHVLEVLDGGGDVLLEDIDDGLAMVPDDSYDTVVLSETLQAMRHPRLVLREILRVARTAIITFPNFGYLPTRLRLMLRGRMPKGSHLPYEWYDTPNIHLFTLQDFLELCRVDGIAVETTRYLSSGCCGRLLIAAGCPNAGADRVIVRIARGAR